MDIKKTFFVETSPDGNTRIYNVNKRFFTGKKNSGGLMERFSAGDTAAKNAYITQLKKEGWLPLSLDDVKKTNVNEIGVVTAYPFKHRKGYMTIEKIEEIARERNHVWESADHFTNPFSALEDYQSFINGLDGSEHDVKALRHQAFGLMDRLENIGAISVIEDFFTEVKFCPDPRRFNKTSKELWLYYKHHLNDCGRLVLHGHIMQPDDQFNIDGLMMSLVEMKAIMSLISDEAHRQWLESGTKNS